MLQTNDRQRLHVDRASTRADHRRMVRIAALAALLSMASVSALAAPDSCRPTRDGKDRMAISGGCPSGHVTRGACCESVLPVQQPTGAKACPAGTMLRLGACVPRQ